MVKHKNSFGPFDSVICVKMCVSILKYLGKKGTGGFDCLVVPDAITTGSGPVGVIAAPPAAAVPAQVCN